VQRNFTEQRSFVFFVLREINHNKLLSTYNIDYRVVIRISKLIEEYIFERT